MSLWLDQVFFLLLPFLFVPFGFGLRRPQTLRSCPHCGRKYPDHRNQFCPRDGSALVDV